MSRKLNIENFVKESLASKGQTSEKLMWTKRKADYYESRIFRAMIDNGIVTKVAVDNKRHKFEYHLSNKAN